MTEPPTVTYVVDQDAYLIARAKARIRSDEKVAELLGIHRVTWTNVLRGAAPLSDEVRRRLRRIFPDDYDHIVRPR